MPKIRFKLLAGLLVLGYLISIGATWGKPQASRWGTLALDRSPESDFLVFYAASTLARSNQPDKVYSIGLKKEQEKILPNCVTRPFWYPPIYLVMLLPLAMVPIYTSLVIWNALTLAGFVAVIRRVCAYDLVIWAALAFPAIFQNVIRGQTGCMSTLIMGAGLLLLKQYPILAGLSFGLMCYKPSLFPLIPVALLAGRHWWALAGTLATTIMLTLISVAIFGIDTWRAYVQQLSLTAGQIQPGFLFEFNITFFGAANFLAHTPLLARMLQCLVMGIMVALVAWSWSRLGPLTLKGSMLVVGMLLFPPYALIYDLTLLALPLAWLSWEGYSKKWIPGEIPLLGMAWLLPALAPFFAYIIKLQISPFILTGLLTFTIMKQHAIVKQQGVQVTIKKEMPSKEMEH